MNSNDMNSDLLLYIKAGAVTNLPPLRKSRPEILVIQKLDKDGIEMMLLEIKHQLSLFFSKTGKRFHITT